MWGQVWPDCVQRSSPITVFPVSYSGKYFVLSVTSHMNCVAARCLINVVYLTACSFIRSWWRYTFWMTSLMTPNQRKKWKFRHVISSLKSETMVKLINRIPGLHLLISSVPGSALRMHVELFGKPCDVNKRSQSIARYTWYQKTLTLKKQKHSIHNTCIKEKWHVIQNPNLCSYKWACWKLIMHMHRKFWVCKWQFYVMHNLWKTV